MNTTRNHKRFASEVNLRIIILPKAVKSAVTINNAFYKLWAN